MKKIILFVLFTVLISTSSFAYTRHPAGSPRSFGLGVVLGDPTAITGKFWSADDRAVDAGFSFFSNNYYILYSDYLFHFPGAIRSAAQLSPYVGVGGQLIFFNNNYYSNGEYYRTGSNSSTIGLGLRIPVGIEWLPSRAPLGIFAEIVPGVLLLPGTVAIVQAGVGVRFYF